MKTRIEKKMLGLRSLALVGIVAMAFLTISCQDKGDIYSPPINEEASLKSGKAIKSDKTITEIVVAAASAEEAEFTTLKSLLVQYDLAGVFDGKKPYTVFAPTDAAFARLFAALGEAGVELTDEQIVNTLLYHVTNGRRAANSVLADEDGEMKKINTLLGQFFMVDNAGGIYTASKGMSSIVTDAPGVTFNIPASNGVIHVIDEVLVPEF